MDTFHLFRIKLLAPSQPSLFPEEDVDRPELLKRLLATSVPHVSQRGQVWRLGNLDRIDSDGYYFALGRTRRAEGRFYDEAARAFVSSVVEDAPYTHCVVDCNVGLCAIAQESQLAPTIETIRRQFEFILQETAHTLVAQPELAVRVEVGPIADPTDFRDLLARAYAITAFKITVSPPNPFDAEADFQKPFSRVINKTNATKGTASLRGANLSHEPLEEIVNAAAATAESASATIKDTATSPPRQISFGRTAASLRFESLAVRGNRAGLLQAIRGLYARIRRRE